MCDGVTADKKYLAWLATSHPTVHTRRKLATYLCGHGQVGGIGGRFDLQVLADDGFHVLEVIFTLPIAFQIHRALRLEA